MVNAPRTQPSASRCRRVVRLIRSHRRDDPANWLAAGPAARLVYVVTALVANDVGVVTEDQIMTAMGDHALVTRAYELLAVASADVGRCA